MQVAVMAAICRLLKCREDRVRCWTATGQNSLLTVWWLFRLLAALANIVRIDSKLKIPVFWSTCSALLEIEATTYQPDSQFGFLDAKTGISWYFYGAHGSMRCVYNDCGLCCALDPFAELPNWRPNCTPVTLALKTHSMSLLRGEQNAVFASNGALVR